MGDGDKIDVNQDGTLNCVSWAWNSKMRYTAHLLYLQRLLQMLVLSLFTLSSDIFYQSQS